MLQEESDGVNYKRRHLLCKIVVLRENCYYNYSELSAACECFLSPENVIILKKLLFALKIHAHTF